MPSSTKARRSGGPGPSAGMLQGEPKASQPAAQELPEDGNAGRWLGPRKPGEIRTPPTAQDEAAPQLFLLYRPWHGRRQAVVAPQAILGLAAAPLLTHGVFKP